METSLEGMGAWWRPVLSAHKDALACLCFLPNLGGSQVVPSEALTGGKVPWSQEQSPVLDVRT